MSAPSDSALGGSPTETPMTERRAIVCGGRTYADAETLNSLLGDLHDDRPFALIIAGGAPGADRLAVEWAEAHGVDFVIEYADWLRDGRAAGPIRNQAMIDRHAPDTLIAFPGGRGTADMMRRAEKAKLEMIVLNNPAVASSSQETPNG